MPDQAPQIDPNLVGGKLIYDKVRRTIVSQPAVPAMPMDAEWRAALAKLDSLQDRKAAGTLSDEDKAFMELVVAASQGLPE